MICNNIKQTTIEQFYDIQDLENEVLNKLTYGMFSGISIKSLYNTKRPETFEEVLNIEYNLIINYELYPVLEQQMRCYNRDWYIRNIFLKQINEKLSFHW